jgi:hypothetical protein
VQNQEAHAFPRDNKCRMPHYVNSNTTLQGINVNRENVLFQDVIAHLANFSMITLEDILDEWLISH